MSAPTLSLELYQLLPKYLTQEQECVHCGSLFKECENIGQHLCRIHPGIRLLCTSNPLEAFYSCCGRVASLKSPWLNGCLECDHQSQYLSESNASLRLAQILETATMTVPHLLLRFITPPLKCAIVYDTVKMGINESPLFIFDSPVLALVEQRNAILNVTYSPQIRDYTESPTTQSEINSRKQIDLEEERHLLWQQAKDSPFFTRFLAKQEGTQNSIQSKCDAIWRTNLSRASLESDQAREEQAEIPFIIISRINNELNSGLMRQ